MVEVEKKTAIVYRKCALDDTRVCRDLSPACESCSVNVILELLYLAASYAGETFPLRSMYNIMPNSQSGIFGGARE